MGVAVSKMGYVIYVFRSVLSYVVTLVTFILVLLRMDENIKCTWFVVLIPTYAEYLIHGVLLFVEKEREQPISTIFIQLLLSAIMPLQFSLIIWNEENKGISMAVALIPAWIIIALSLCVVCPPPPSTPPPPNHSPPPPQHSRAASWCAHLTCLTSPHWTLTTRRPRPRRQARRRLWSTTRLHTPTTGRLARLRPPSTQPLTTQVCLTTPPPCPALPDPYLPLRPSVPPPSALFRCFCSIFILSGEDSDGERMKREGSTYNPPPVAEGIETSFRLPIHHHAPLFLAPPPPPDLDTLPHTVHTVSAPSPFLYPPPPTPFTCDDTRTQASPKQLTNIHNTGADEKPTHLTAQQLEDID